MTTDERLDRLAQSLDTLRGIVDSLAASVVAHDQQIEGLIRVAEKQAAQIAALERQWQAYINTLPRT